MIFVLISGLEVAINNQLNACFRDQLDCMLKECRSEFNELLKNDYLVMASLLDPRYTVQVEKLTGKSFKDYQRQFTDIINSFREQDYSPDSAHTSDNEATEANSTNDETSFWDLFDESSSVDNGLPSSQRAFEDQLEVSV